MYRKGAGNDKQAKDAGNRTLCPYRNFSQAIIKHNMKVCLIASLIARVHGKVRSLCKSLCGSCNQLQDNHISYEFNKDLHNLSHTRGTISRGG